MRLVTLNVWGHPDWIGRDGELRMRAIAAHWPRLSPDVIAIQEVWTEAWRESVLEGASAAGLTHAWHNPETLGGSGLVVCSRYPIQDAQFTPFSVCGHAEQIQHGDYYSGKGFASLRIDAPSGAWRLFNTHLVAQYAPDDRDRYRGQRVGQLVELALAVATTRLPVVAMGDFNIDSPGDLVDLWLGLSGTRDVAAELGRARPTAMSGNPYRGTGSRDARIDYVFVRNGESASWRASRADRVFDETLDFDGRPGSPSDHAGVLVELGLEPGGAPPIHADRETLQEAARWLATGRARARDRQRGQRAAAGGAAALALASTGAALSRRVSRRRLLRAGSMGLALLGATGAAGFGWLAEGFAPEEIEGLARAEAALKALRERAGEGDPSIPEETLPAG